MLDDDLPTILSILFERSLMEYGLSNLCQILHKRNRESKLFRVFLLNVGRYRLHKLQYALQLQDGTPRKFFRKSLDLHMFSIPH